MNLGIRQQWMAIKIGPGQALLVFACASALCLGSASAQDMSFDLDEIDAAPPPSEEPPAEPGPAPGAGEPQGTTDDIFSELSADSDAAITGSPQPTGPRHSEVVEEIYAVQRMYVLRRSRLELAPSLAFSINDPFTSRTAVGAAANYWITNVLAIGGNFLWYQGLETESDLNFSLQRFARLAAPITEYQLGAHLNFTYVPLYGKFTMFNSAIFQWDAYLVGGVGMLRTRPIAVVDPAVRKFDFDWRVSLNAGLGLRVFVTKWLSVFAELRDYIYLEKLENLDVELGELRNDPSTWTDDSATVTHNIATHIGISMFFPFSFGYKYPK